MLVSLMPLQVYLLPEGVRTEVALEGFGLRVDKHVSPHVAAGRGTVGAVGTGVGP